MQHLKIYENIITKAKSENRIKKRKYKSDYIYYENHHIIPKCVGGSNDESNLVCLTAKEHFICHKLLLHIYPGDRKIMYGYVRMVYSQNGKRIKSASEFAYVRELIKNTPIPQDVRDKISQSCKGKVRSTEFKEKNRISHLGTNSGETCNLTVYIKNNRKGNTLKNEMITLYGEEEGLERYLHWKEGMKNAKLNKELTNLHKVNIGNSLRGRKRTDTEKENIRLGWIKRKQQLTNIQI